MSEVAVETQSPIREALRKRRTVFEFKPEPVPDDLLMRILEVGAWGPNHLMTEPWRFTIIGPETKRTLGERYREIQMAKVADHVSDELRAVAGDKGVQKWNSKPTVVFVSCRQEGDEQERREDYAATCCAMLAIQLAAAEEGVGLQWSTGPITMEENTYELLGIDSSKEYIIGLLYMGFPAAIKNPAPRMGIEEVTRRAP